MSTKTEEQLKRDMCDEMMRWKDPVIFEMDVATVITIIASLQLSLRHPVGGKTKAAAIVEDFIRRFQEKIPEDCPALRKIIEMGFDNYFDR